MKQIQWYEQSLRTVTKKYEETLNRLRNMLTSEQLSIFELEALEHAIQTMQELLDSYQEEYKNIKK